MAGVISGCGLFYKGSENMRYNYYDCKNYRQSTIAQFDEKVTSPMFSICGWCGGEATSAMSFKDKVPDECKLSQFPIKEFFYNADNQLDVKTIQYSPFIRREIEQAMAVESIDS